MRLPERAAQGRGRDPEAIGFLLIEPTDGCMPSLIQAVRTRLTTAEVHAEVVYDPSSLRMRAMGLSVGYASLFVAAAKTRRASVVSEVELLWKERAGSAAIALHRADASEDSLSLMAPDPWGSTAHAWIASNGWQERSATELVAEAASALRLPRWTLEQVTRLWGEVAGTDAEVYPAAGHYKGAYYSMVPSLHFAAQGRAWDVDIEQIRGLDADELVLRAAEECGLSKRVEGPAALSSTSTQATGVPLNAQNGRRRR